MIHRISHIENRLDSDGELRVECFGDVEIYINREQFAEMTTAITERKDKVSKIGQHIVELQERDAYRTGYEAFQAGAPDSLTEGSTHEDRAAFHLGWLAARDTHFDA